SPLRKATTKTKTPTAMLRAGARPVRAIHLQSITTAAAPGEAAIPGPILVLTLAGAWEFGDPDTADSADTAASAEKSGKGICPPPHSYRAVPQTVICAVQF